MTADEAQASDVQAREVEVLAGVVLNHFVAAEDPFITCLCGRRWLTVTEWCKHVAEEGAAALAPVRAAERQEAAREALLAAADDFVINGYTGQDAYLTPEAREWLRRRADGVAGREDV